MKTLCCVCTISIGWSSANEIAKMHGWCRIYIYCYTSNPENRNDTTSIIILDMANDFIFPTQTSHVILSTSIDSPCHGKSFAGNKIAIHVANLAILTHTH